MALILFIKKETVKYDPMGPWYDAFFFVWIYLKNNIKMQFIHTVNWIHIKIHSDHFCFGE